MILPGVTDLLAKADQSLAAAEHLYAEGFTDFAVGRAYYAMFYATEAILLTKDLSFSKHAAVIAAFGQHFVKTGILDPSLHRYLLEGFDLRNLGDYGAVHAVDDADANHVLQNAKTFCTFVKNYIALLDS